MNNNSFSFDQLDLSAVEAKSSQLLQPGSHIVKISDAAYTKNNAGTGWIVKVTFANTDGVISTTYNVSHSSAEAQRIGREQFKTMLVNANHPNPDRPSDISTLKGLSVGIRIKAEGKYTNKDGKEFDNLVVSGSFKPTGNAGGDTSSIASLKSDIPF